MSNRHKPSIRPTLPKSILDQLNGSIDSNNARNANGKLRSQSSRKELRKQERLQRKHKKAEFFSAVLDNASNRGKRHADGEHAESPQRKKVKTSTTPARASLDYVRANEEPSEQPQSDLPPRSKPPTKMRANSDSKSIPRRETPLEKLVTRSKAKSGLSSVIPRTQREKDEDAYIAYLESKLGYSKGGKTKPIDDGLDDLLDFTASLGEPVIHSDDESTESSEDEMVGDTAGSVGRGAEDNEFEDDDQEWHGFTETVENAPSQVVESHSPNATRYVPPHLRNRSPQGDGKDSETRVKLTRRLKGLLNRMSEQNMTIILDGIEDVYRNYSRHDVMSTLTTLIIDGISSHSSLLDSYVVLYAAFISSLHKIVGVEFAAYFVQNVVSAYERYLSALHAEDSADLTASSNDETRGKECSNLVVLISELYNFQVISCILVYDVIRDLLSGNLSEFDVELLLKVLRNSGQQLRQDDPNALKDIIQVVQTKVSNQGDVLNSRMQFMVDTLTDLKNNKIKRNITLNQGGEAVERMKKFLSGLGKKRTWCVPIANFALTEIEKNCEVHTHEPLRVTLEDLRSADSKGKWWLVGAAWGGDPLVDRQQVQDQADAQAKIKEELGNNTLLKLARKQGMNTDIRRSIFVVLMSSDDYVDACERLSQLNLTEVQQREIIRVILHCCGNEKSYNPYYTLVAQHLCRSSHSYKVTLQFCLWDFLRNIGETNVGGAEIIKNVKDDDVAIETKTVSSTRLRNVAKAYAWWVAKDCLTLMILKPVDFTSLKKRTQEFLEEFFSEIFIDSQVTTPVIGFISSDILSMRNRGALEEIFIKATRIETLAMGIVYFISQAFREDNQREISKLIKWAIGIAKDTLQTG